MSYKAYKYTFKLHISHNMNPSSEQQTHYHTIKIILYIQNEKDNKFSKYDETEKIVTDYLNQYEGKYINNTTLFQGYIPTIENMGKTFYDQLKDLISRQGLNLMKLEISETPTRIFSISEKILLT